MRVAHLRALYILVAHVLNFDPALTVLSNDELYVSVLASACSFVGVPAES